MNNMGKDSDINDGAAEDCKPYVCHGYLGYNALEAKCDVKRRGKLKMENKNNFEELGKTKNPWDCQRWLNRAIECLEKIKGVPVYYCTVENFTDGSSCVAVYKEMLECHFKYDSNTQSHSLTLALAPKWGGTKAFPTSLNKEDIDKSVFFSRAEALQAAGHLCYKAAKEIMGTENENKKVGEEVSE